MKRPSAYKAILLGGLIAGILDITFAFIFYYALRGSTPIRILQSVASGALGAKAFAGGAKTAALGAFFHFLIAITAAAVYYVASRPLRFLVRQPFIWGVIYGVAIYLFMNFVVIPLSALPAKPSYPLRVLIPGLLIHMFGIGAPIALVTRRYAK